MKINKQEISIIGGAGHVGFPLGIAFASKRFKVNLIDKNKIFLNRIKKGVPPFLEKGAKKLLKKPKLKKKIFVSNNYAPIKTSKYIIICIGTPINQNLKPRVKEFLSFFYFLKKIVSRSQIIIIRSSIFPGVFKKVAKILDKRNQNIVYCPERIVQGNSLEELPKLPQILAGKSNFSIKESKKLFSKITKTIIETTVLEAELIKLFSNANRYINFSIANQLFMICEEHNLNYSKIRKVMREGYERNINLPSAGFTSGPCLLKDTMQLSSFYRKKFSLGYAAMNVNENIPNFILKKIKKIKNIKKKKIGVLGITFKAETDDTRDSLALKLIKLLKKSNMSVLQSDEYCLQKNNIEKKELIRHSDVIIIAAPHKAYKKIKVPKNKILIDIWGIKN